MTSSKDVEKISHFLSRFALGHLLGLLGPADHLLPLWILVSYSLDIIVTKSIEYNDKFVHLQIGSCKCQYSGLWVQIYSGPTHEKNEKMGAITKFACLSKFV